jgi:hypothetical protein
MADKASYPSGKEVMEILMGDGDKETYYEADNGSVPEDLRMGDWIIGEDGRLVSVAKKIVVPVRITHPTLRQVRKYRIAYIVREVD